MPHENRSAGPLHPPESRSRPEKPKVVLAVDSLAPGDGGISRVARLMTRVLEEMVDRDEIELKLLVTRRLDPSREGDGDIEFFAGNLARFFVRNQWLGRSATHYLYDSLALARAHPKVWPYPRPFLSWVYGVEVWGEEVPERIRRRRIRWAKRADVLLACSDFTRQRAGMIDSQLSRARTCWLGTEVTHGQARSEPPAGQPTVLTLGRIEAGRDKGHQLLLGVWPQVVSRVPSARLLVVGTGAHKRRLEETFGDLIDRGQVEFKGFVPDGEMNEIWRQADVLAMPSRGEGFGLVYVEAMRQGLPVVASVHDAAHEININGQTGFNVSLDDPAELVARLVELLATPPLARKMGNAGFRRWEQNFTFSRFRDRFAAQVREFFSCEMSSRSLAPDGMEAE